MTPSSPNPLCAALAALCLLGAPTRAQDAPTCRLALAINVSRSVDEADFRLQIDGTIAALRDPGVTPALFGPPERVALTIYHRRGAGYQQEIYPWTLIDSPQTLEAAIQALAATEKPWPMNTGLGAALAFGLDRMAEAPDCARQVLDMAGDGQNNEGPLPHLPGPRSGRGGGQCAGHWRT